MSFIYKQKLYIKNNLYIIIMVLYFCEKCHKEFNRISNYKRHSNVLNCVEKLQNKKFECNYCDISLSKKAYIQRHLLICKKTKKQPIINISADNTVNGNSNENIFNNNVNNTINNIDNSITNIDNSINIDLTFKLCDFGKENYELLDMDKIFGNTEGYLFFKLVEALHFNPKCEQNYNILMTDLNRPNIKIIKDEEWISQTKEDVLKKIVDKTFLYLNEIKDTFNNDNKNKIEMEIKQFIFGELDNFYNEHRLKLNSRVSNLIFDNNTNVKKIYKKHKKRVNEINKINKSNKKYKKNVSIETDNSDSD